ncbi:MAG: electron transfer flavoprotein subunit alpha/FixB family protein [Bacteroidetes bacterium]|nr:MAG: electron transfer flavoprotein subunit alpha/FixB family protein [Bacteroidota bacterium]
MVLVFVDCADGVVKKQSYEVLCYGAALARQQGVAAQALVLGTVADAGTLGGLGNFGVTKVHHLEGNALQHFDAQVFAKTIADAVIGLGASVLVLSHTTTGKALAPRLSVRLGAGLVAGAVALPNTDAGFVVKKAVFSGKAFAHVSINTPIKIVSLNPNAFGISKTDNLAEVETTSPQVAAGRVVVKAVNRITGTVPLAEADLVVSGGRGLKGPENWHLVEDLAKEIGAATACSRAVADAHWRPHHEHVGQTGGAVAPNLYFAIGISGAIQHLAGVNRSKTIVVINKDPEAPFFKAADYGIVGDAFEVMPQVIAAVRKLKAGV